jgi:hypothetical protein
MHGDHPWFDISKEQKCITASKHKLSLPVLSQKVVFFNNCLQSFLLTSLSLAATKMLLFELAMVFMPNGNLFPIKRTAFDQNPTGPGQK